MTLLEYLQGRGESCSNFARRCGVTPTAVAQWIRGKTEPRRETRQRIELATGGKVTRADMSDLEAARAYYEAHPPPPPQRMTGEDAA